MARTKYSSPSLKSWRVVSGVASTKSALNERGWSGGNAKMKSSGGWAWLSGLKPLKSGSPRDLAA